MRKGAAPLSVGMSIAAARCLRFREPMCRAISAVVKYLPSGNQTKAREGQHRRCCSRQGFGLSRLGKTKKASSMWRITEAACIGWSLVDGIL